MIIEQTTQDHIDKLKGRLRASDDRECWAVAHVMANEGLKMTYNRSPLCWTLLNDDEPILCFGVAMPSILCRIAYPWMMATDKIDKAGFYFAKRIRKYIKKHGKSFDILVNWVDSRNKTAVRFIEWCGFNIDPPMPFGPDNVLFHRFWMRMN